MTSQGYLLDFSDFYETLRGIFLHPDSYKEIEVSYLKFGWQIRFDSPEKFVIAIQGVRQSSIEEAYEHFKNNPSLHEKIYHQAMSIWR